MVRLFWLLSYLFVINCVIFVSLVAFNVKFLLVGPWHEFLEIAYNLSHWQL